MVGEGRERERERKRGRQEDRETEREAAPHRATRTDHHDIVLVVDDVVGARRWRGSESQRETERETEREVQRVTLLIRRAAAGPLGHDREAPALRTSHTAEAEAEEEVSTRARRERERVAETETETETETDTHRDTQTHRQTHAQHRARVTPDTAYAPPLPVFLSLARALSLSLSGAQTPHSPQPSAALSCPSSPYPLATQETQRHRETETRRDNAPPVSAERRRGARTSTASLPRSLYRSLSPPLPLSPGRSSRLLSSRPLFWLSPSAGLLLEQLAPHSHTPLWH